MIKKEAIALCRFVQACCPQQKFDEFTPDAWLDILEDLPYGLAKLAAKQVAKAQPFVSPAEILSMTNQMRRAAKIPVSVAVDEAEGAAPSDPDVNFIEWSRERRKRVAYLADLALARGLVTFATEDVFAIRAQVDVAQLPIERKPELPTADHRRDIDAIITSARKEIHA